MKPKLIVGIDVSKSDLDYLSIDQGSNWLSLADFPVTKLSNAASTIREFLLNYPPKHHQDNNKQHLNFRIYNHHALILME